MTVLHAGGKMTSDAGGYVASGGLHGVGASCVNALSDKMIVEVHRDGYQYKQEYCRGEPQGDVKKVRKLEKSEKQTGTKSTWHSDIEIFKHGIKLDENEIIRRIRETCFLNRGLHITFENKATTTKHDFKFEGGIADYVLYLIQNKNGIYPDTPIYAQKQAKECK
jgi:DNA gyrase subunit B